MAKNGNHSKETEFERWNQRQDAKEEFIKIDQACRDVVTKVKVYLDTRKKCQRATRRASTSSLLMKKKLNRGNVSPLLSVAKDLVTA